MREVVSRNNGIARLVWLESQICFSLTIAVVGFVVVVCLCLCLSGRIPKRGNNIGFPLIASSDL
jgi:hypothetical protein